MKRTLSVTSLLAALLFLTTGCADSTDPFSFDPDHSNVPDLPELSSHEPVEFNGVTYYVIEEGSGEFSLQDRRDETARIFLTFRLKEGNQILQSTYADFNETPENVTIEELSEPGGLLDGVLGMKEGERRVIVVPPERGFANVSQNSQFYPFRNDTLVYDVEVVEIL